MTAEDLSLSAIASSRKLHRSLNAKLIDKGVIPVDCAVGAAYALHDLATRMFDGDSVAAIEWMRTAVDVQERQLLDPNRQRRLS